MTADNVQHEFGYFGKLPPFGDFIQQTLPQDFANGFHGWLQHSMAAAREALGDEFLTHYLNCPAWKFLLAGGVCGSQPITGLTIPSVDKVGRYFNFTLATVLPPDIDPVAYVAANQEGFRALESLALDILELDLPKEELELKVREVSLQFHVMERVRSEIDRGTAHIKIGLNRALPFLHQASALLTHLLQTDLGGFGIWWYGQEGQTSSNMFVCQGMPDTEIYRRLLTQDMPSAETGDEANYIDQIIAGDT
jgi:type VI secretion system protein ImpM